MNHLHLILPVTISVLLASCTRDRDTFFPAEVEYEFWGEEVIWNDVNESVTLTLIDQYDGDESLLYYPGKVEPLVLNIPSGSSVTLLMPNYAYQRCLHTAVQVTISGDGFEDVVFPAGSYFFNSYDLVEKDYYVTIDGKTYLEEKKWPVYTYHIARDLITNHF